MIVTTIPVSSHGTLPDSWNITASTSRTLRLTSMWRTVTRVPRLVTGVSGHRKAALTTSRAALTSDHAAIVIHSQSGRVRNQA